MLDRDAARALCERVLGASRADACEVHLSGGHDALTRFANNEIHQNMASESYELSVRSIVGRRTGRASTTRLDDAGIRHVVAESERITRLMPEREDLLPLVPAQEYAVVAGAHDAATAGLDAAARAELAQDLIAAAQARKWIAAGSVRLVEGDVGPYGEKGTIAIANSNGLFGFYTQTRLKLTVTAMGSDSSGWADGEAHARRDLDARELGRIAADKAAASTRPVSIPAGASSVILEPAAVAELLAFLGPAFDATVVDEGRSFLSHRQGRLFGSNVHIVADPYHPLHRGRPFDEEGMPVQRTVLVEAGEQRGLVYDRVAAARHAKRATGHALRVPSDEGALASCLVLRGGTTSLAETSPAGTSPAETSPAAMSLAEMIRGTARGVLVTRVWYTRPVDPRQLLITGMTRDGTFLIEDGQVRSGIKNMRFNQSLIELLCNITALGPETYAWPCVVPPLRADGFRFTSETVF